MPGSSSARNAHSTETMGKFWTLANALSLFRLALVFPIAYLILVEGPALWLLGLVVLAVVTDWFDGRVARWSHTVSEWGKVLDPLADKVASALVVLALVVKGLLPEWLLLLVLFRDIGIVACGVILVRRTGQIIMSAWSGKVAVTALALTCIAALLRADQPVLNVCIWTTAALLVYSQLVYLVRFFRYMRMGRLQESTAGSKGTDHPVSSMEKEGEVAN